MKKNFLNKLLFLFFSYLSIINANTLEEIKQRNKILIAVDIGAPPYGMLDINAKQTGFDIDVANLLAKDLGVELEIITVTSPNRIPFLLSKKVDIVIASFSITKERKKIIDFSVPYGVVPTVLGGPVEESINSFNNLTNKTIAVTRGTTSDLELTKQLKEGNYKINVNRYEDEATLITSISTGREKYFVTAPGHIMTINKTNPKYNIENKFVLNNYPCAIGIRKNDLELKKTLDNWVIKNLKNGKLNNFYKKYFNMSLDTEKLQKS